jgi:hypothetical protein
VNQEKVIGDKARYRTHLSWGATLQIVRSTSGMEDLIMKFNKSSKEEHLRLAPSGDSIPGLKTLGWDRRKVKTVSKFTGESNTGSDSPPPYKGSHGHASVLNFRMTVPRDGFIGSDFSKSKGIPNATEFGSVGLRKNGFARNAGIHGGCGHDLVGGWCKGRGHAKGGKDEGGRGLHGCRETDRNFMLNLLLSLVCVRQPPTT